MFPLSCSLASLVLVLCLAAFISFVLQIVTFDEEPLITSNVTANYPPPDLDPVVLDDKLNHLMWFMQVSDTHLSIYFDPKRMPDLKRLCTEVVDVIKPSVVLATGDLTDARTPGPFGSEQHEREWQMYQEVIRDTNVTAKTVWLDIRGNHDVGTSPI